MRDVVLKIGVDADANLSPNLREARQQRILMPDVARQLDAGDAPIFAIERFDDAPGAVLAAVVDEHDAAAFADLARRDQVEPLALERAGGFGQGRFSL